MIAAIPSRKSAWSSTLKMRIRVSSVMAVCLLSSAPALALDPSLELNQYAHTFWTLRESKFKGYPKSLAQMADGYLWLGNEFGLTRFDGVRFVPWQPPAGSRLPSASIVKLLASRDGGLWIGTTRGLARWKDGALTHVQEVADQYVTALFEDHGGALWLGTSGGLAGTARVCVVAHGSVRCEASDGRLGRFVSAFLHAVRGTIS